MSMVNNNKIFILAGESSSDLIGSFIMKGLKKNSKELNFFGVGGSNMMKEGLRSVYEINSFNIKRLLYAKRFLSRKVIFSKF